MFVTFEGNQNKHKILDTCKFQPDPSITFPLEHRKKSCGHNSPFIFGHIKLADNNNWHKILDEFEFRPDLPIYFGELSTQKLYHWLLMEKKCCFQPNVYSFHWIFDKLADNQDRHNISDKLEFWSDSKVTFGVTCPWAPEKNVVDKVPSIFYRPFFKLAEQTHGVKRFLFGSPERGPWLVLELLLAKNLEKVQIWLDLPIHFGVTCPWSV